MFPPLLCLISLVRLVALLSTQHIPAARPRSQRTLGFPGAGHGQGPLPRDREDSIGMPFARFQRTLAVLPQGSITRRCAPFRCFRPVFSARGSWCGSQGKHLRQCHPLFVVQPMSPYICIFHRLGSCMDTGKLTMAVKRSAMVSTRKVPPQASVKLLATDRPKPVPPSVRLSSPRTNRAVKSTPSGSSLREVLRMEATAALSVVFRER